MGYKAKKVEFIKIKCYNALCKAVVHRGEYRMAESPVRFRATCIVRAYRSGMSFCFKMKYIPTYAMQQAKENMESIDDSPAKRI